MNNHATNSDLSTCPGCGGPADNGHDRCVPPTAYYCTKCNDGHFLDDVIENLIADPVLRAEYDRAREDLLSLGEGRLEAIVDQVFVAQRGGTTVSQTGADERVD
jgi:hypothetical protein